MGYGNWVRFRPPAPREEAAGAAGVEQQGGGPLTPQVMAVQRFSTAEKMDKWQATRDTVETALDIAVAHGYVCSVCVHRKVRCGCQQYEEKIAAVVAGRLRDTTGTDQCALLKRMDRMPAFALVCILVLAGIAWLFWQY